jgi:hypothetical protein
LNTVVNFLFGVKKKLLILANVQKTKFNTNILRIFQTHTILYIYLFIFSIVNIHCYTYIVTHTLLFWYSIKTTQHQSNYIMKHIDLWFKINKPHKMNNTSTRKHVDFCKLKITNRIALHFIYKGAAQWWIWSNMETNSSN